MNKNEKWRVAAPEVARDTDRSPDYRTVTVPSAGASSGGGYAVIALPTTPPVDATQCPTRPTAITIDSPITVMVLSDCLSVSNNLYCSGIK
jgi:hypothetical protein